MLTRLEIEGFRTFRELTVEKLARVNLFVGKNNAGKTSLLDAVEILIQGGSPSALWQSGKRRRELVPPSGEASNGAAKKVDRLREKGVDAPDMPELEGTIIRPGLQGPSSRIGIWIMPDNQRPGALEHFLSTLVPPGDPCISYAGEATTRARALGAPLAEKDHMKGVLRTWLAWQAHPGVPPGVALKAKALGHDSAEALRFVAWFKRLFLEPADALPHA